MRVLVLFAHPVETSFAAALHQRVLDGLRSAGHEVDDCDLYAEGFDPRLTREERLAYHDLDINRANVASYVDRLLAAEALVLVHPVWNFGLPAILKGFFDRVFLPGVSFKMKNGKVAPSLHNIRKLTVVTTYGGTRLRAFLVGDPPRKIATRVLRAVIKPAAPLSYMALYDMNRATDDDRAAFLGRVGKAMERF
ncbi:NAD(P)H-dependent oxidoreductase [Polymorphum gilvum]|uniref:NAD(P)H dehydrogenase (Quinone) n=1 Tax=Polymorphum gilvum (strain LMG 25793 / CGMCC 1.9160 / SL003B-26A1) TaxID=991905 RepID=F2IWC7_POLGS|nr:NAD(P)H-dependent oxidoreductase [Polymorphum gilvum]ADZ69226.1 NAD(P)H dehydrogenase (Quinone) [Polymorphum gilvum SL003B-26A1]